MRLCPFRAAAVGLALVVASAAGQPADPGPRSAAVFAEYDADADGRLSRAEFDAFAATLPRMAANPRAAGFVFGRLDADSDGNLTADEFRSLAGLPGLAANQPRPNPFARPAGTPPKPGDNPFARPGASAKTPAAAPAPAARPTAEQIAFFEKKIRPVLAEQCYSCHSVADEQFKGGLAVDSRNALLVGGDSGPAVVPGNPARSPLLLAMHGRGDFKMMPPKTKLPDEVLADFEKWIRAGAHDPRTDDTTTAKKPDAIDIEEGKKHWAFQPPKKIAPPAVTNADWPATDIDRFVLAKLDANGLTPSADADRNTLIRRVYFDLIGLPPTPAEVEAFANDPAPDAFEKVVDRLLASPRFGERWGRHWLDVARYAESSGKEQNIVYPTAWRYRDWVIDALNRDLPYDRFVTEQLAGDLLPAADDTDRAKKLIATGYLAVGPKSHNTRSRTQFTLDLADEQIDAFTQGMLGLTVACARCHDHKFDPVPMADYYAIAGIFTSTDTKFGTPSTLISRFANPLEELPAGADVPSGEGLSARELAVFRRQLDSLKEQRAEAIARARKDGQTPVSLVRFNVQIGVIEKSWRTTTRTALRRSWPWPSPTAGPGRTARSTSAANRTSRATPSPAGSCKCSLRGREIASGSGRKELAAWVASADNPLTARVMANRVWGHLFGRGLVPTPDNFGTTGQPPSHPELLDHLAATFVEDGWSVKALIRRLVLTRTYRQASTYDAADAATDPANVFHWRMSPRRLDAEAIRDAMLAVAGELDTEPMVGSPVAKFEGPVQGLQRLGGGVEKLADTAHRSVYLPIIRDDVPEVLALFDFAEPSLVTGARDDTSVPAQGLYLLNNPKVIDLAEKTAEKLVKSYLSPSERIDAGFRLAFGRPPTADEEQAAAAFMDRFRAAEKGREPARRTFRNPFRQGGGDADETAVWAAFVQALFAAAEFRYVD